MEDQTEVQKVGMLEEAPGVSSTIRILSVYSFVAAIGVMTIDLLGYDKSGQALVYFTMLICFAFVPKVGQKFAENLKKG